MEQDERTPRSPSAYEEPTRRISLYEEEERTQRLELPPPPWDASEGDGEPRAKRGRHVERSPRHWSTTLTAGLVGFALGVVATLLVTGVMLQRAIADRDARITQLTSELDLTRAEQENVSTRRAALDRREFALDQREQELNDRERALDQREQELGRREAALEGRIPLPGIDLPDGNLSRGILDRLGQRIQDLVKEMIPSNPGGN
jgi:hypothetical protein